MLVAKPSKNLQNQGLFTTHIDPSSSLYTNKSASMVYDPQSYDDIPIYTWDETFNTDTLAHNIDACNDLIWLYVKDAICGKLAIPYRPGGYRNYSTRRIRRQVCGSDLATVQEKQITIPVVMPWSLENYLLATVPQHFPATPSHTDNFSPIIPVHDSAKYDQRNATIPSLRDTVAETGNLRYWVITNESMWAQQDRALDEFAELMWSMFYWFMQAMTSSPNDATSTRMNTDRKACTWSLVCTPRVIPIRARLGVASPEFVQQQHATHDSSKPKRNMLTPKFAQARAFRRRIVLPEVLDNLDVGMKPGLPTLRETLLFRPWALTSPVSPDRDRVDEDGEAIPTGKHALFNEEAVLYPFPTELFWKDGDEGEWDGDGVPQWVDVD